MVVYSDLKSMDLASNCSVSGRMGRGREISRAAVCLGSAMVAPNARSLAVQGACWVAGELRAGQVLLPAPGMCQSLGTALLERGNTSDCQAEHSHLLVGSFRKTVRVLVERARLVSRS